MGAQIQRLRGAIIALAWDPSYRLTVMRRRLQEIGRLSMVASGGTQAANSPPNHLRQREAVIRTLAGIPDGATGCGASVMGKPNRADWHYLRLNELPRSERRRPARRYQQ